MRIFTRDLLFRAFPDSPRLRGQLEQLDDLLGATSDTTSANSDAAASAQATADEANGKVWQPESDLLSSIAGLPSDGVGVVEIVTANQTVIREVDSDAASLLSRAKGMNAFGKGATSARPSPPSDMLGVYFDTTLNTNGKPVFWTGSAWVDSTGAIV